MLSYDCPTCRWRLRARLKRSLRVREEVSLCLRILNHLDTPVLSCVGIDFLVDAGTEALREMLFTAKAVKTCTLGARHTFVLYLYLDLPSRSVVIYTSREGFDVGMINQRAYGIEEFDATHPTVLDIHLRTLQGVHLAKSLCPLLPIDDMRSLVVYLRALDESFGTRLHERTRSLAHLFVGCGLQDEAFAEELLRERVVKKEDEDVAHDCVLPRLRALAVMGYRFAERDPRTERDSRNDEGSRMIPTLIDALRKRAEKKSWRSCISYGPLICGAKTCTRWGRLCATWNGTER